MSVSTFDEPEQTEPPAKAAAPAWASGDRRVGRRNSSAGKASMIIAWTSSMPTLKVTSGRGRGRRPS